MNSATTLYLNGEMLTGDIILSDTTSAIPDYTFINSTITSIEVPDSVTSIGSYAFYGCTSLTNIAIPDSVTSIGSYAFYGCTLITNITVPDDVNSIGKYTFYNCTSLENVTIGNSVTYIGIYAFYNCASLENVAIGNNVTSIDDYAFNNCTSLTSVYYRGTASQWASITFRSSSSNPIYYAGNLYIDGMLVTDITLEDITSINAYAFYNCASLTNVTLGNDVTCIKKYTIQK